jgi:hypothetical protein
MIHRLVFWAAATLWPPPPAYSIVPDNTTCRIFRQSLRQGDCGACGAFAVSAWFAMRRCLAHGVDEIPSPYRLFDCAGGQCNGGLPMLTAIQSGGMWHVGDIDASPPSYGLACEYPPQNGAFTVFTYASAERDTFRSALQWWGPFISVVEHPNDIFSLQPISERPHAVVVVGWTSDGWLIQNSWGDGWGDEFGRGVIPWDGIRIGYRPVYLRPRHHIWMVLVAYVVVCATLHEVWLSFCTSHDNQCGKGVLEADVV